MPGDTGFIGGSVVPDAPSFNKTSSKIPQWVKNQFRSVGGATESFIHLHPNCVSFTIRVPEELVTSPGTPNSGLVVSLKAGEVVQPAGLVGGEHVEVILPGQGVSFAVDRVRASNPRPIYVFNSHMDTRRSGILEEGPARIYMLAISGAANGAQLAGGGSPLTGIAYPGASSPGFGTAQALTIDAVAASTLGKAVFHFAAGPVLPAFVSGMVLEVSGTAAYDGWHTVTATSDIADTVTTATDFTATDTGTANLWLPGDDTGISGAAGGAGAEHCEYFLVQELFGLDDQVTREAY